MARYVTRPARAHKPLYVETPLWPDASPMTHSVTVDDHVATFTGLLDANGEEIWRAPNPVGFGRNGEW